jgi:hypothetical protein
MLVCHRLEGSLIVGQELRGPAEGLYQAWVIVLLQDWQQVESETIPSIVALRIRGVLSKL